MKVYTNIGVIVGMLLFSSIAQGQSSYNRYTQPKYPFQLDTAFNFTSTRFRSNVTTNHLWLTTLNSQYIDTTKNKINPAAIPVYVPLKKNSLSNPNSAINQIIGATVPYACFPYTHYGLTAYDPANRQYTALPYGYSPYTLRAPGSPYFLSTKF